MRRFRFGMPALVLGGIFMLGHGGWAAVVDCDPTPCDPTPRSHVIVVTASGVSCKEAHVSKVNLHVVRWCSADGTNLQVYFEPPTPFPKLQQKYPNEWKSGPISPTAKDDGTPYKYHVFLDGKEVDPNVIIDH